MIGTPLQATDIGCFTSTGDGWMCFIDATVAAFQGPTILGAIVGSLLILALYMASGYHPAPPSIGTMLLGGLLIPWLPPQYQNVGLTVMVLGFIIGVFFLLRRYSMEVGR